VTRQLIYSEIEQERLARLENIRQRYRPRDRWFVGVNVGDLGAMLDRIEELETVAADALAWGEAAVQAGCRGPDGETDETLSCHAVANLVILANLRQALGVTP
jgi:hypothetical protein